MSISEELRVVMSHLPTGVTVISTRDAAGAPTGTTANAVTSVSLEPPLLLVSLAHDSETLAAIRGSGAFTVNVLAEHQDAVSSGFARKGGAGKVKGVELIDEEGSAPYLAESIAHLRCSVHRLIEVGDHELVIGEVVGLRTAEADVRPLLFFRGRYSRLHDEDVHAPAAKRPSPTTRDEVPTVAIVGGGFSGTMTAVQLLRRRHPDGLRIVVIERRAEIGRGLAYSTPHLAHRLNVPVGQMSALPDAPAHFLRWARERDPSIGPDSFAPRQLFGDYLEDVLAAAEREAAGGVRLERVRDEAIGVAIEETPTVRARVALRSGADVLADRLVLAYGNLPPADPPWADPELLASDRYVADPWSPRPPGEEPGARSAILLGSGLTMVDVALTFGAAGAQPALHAISRHGLLPRAHLDDSPPAPSTEAPLEAKDLREALPELMAAAAAAADRGSSWRDAVDSLRPSTNRIWTALSEDERRYFVERLARLWEIHRHRMAPEVAMAVAGMREAGHLSLLGAEIQQARLSERGVELGLRRRGGARAETIAADVMVNCTGPAADVTAIAEPLLESLLGQGMARPDALRLGLDVDRHGALRDRDGESSGLIFAIGPMRKGALWETTAVPELRTQADDLAERLTLSSSLARAATVGERARPIDA